MAKRRKTKLSSKAQRQRNKAWYRTNTKFVKNKRSKNYEINKTVEIQNSLAYKERAKRTNKRRTRRLACTHSKRLYTKKPEVKKTYCRSKYAQNKRSEKRRFSLYYRKLKNQLCSSRRNKYALAEPDHKTVETNKKLLEKKLYADLLARQQLIEALKQLQHSLGEKVSNRVIGMTACTLAAYRLTSRAIQARRTNVHELLQACRAISNMQIATKADFGQGLHSASTEPYFFEGAYMHGAFDSSHALPISRDGKCVSGELVILQNKDGSPKPLHWKCHAARRPLSDEEVDTVVSLREAFNQPMAEIRHIIHTYDDGCLNTHYDRVTDNRPLPRLGHPLVCHIDSDTCKSKLRVVRNGSVHYPVLGSFLNLLNRARASSTTIDKIDCALSTGDFEQLMLLTGTKDFQQVLDIEESMSYQMSRQETRLATSKLRDPNIEAKTLLKHATSLAEFQKAVDGQATIACISCCVGVQLSESASLTPL